MQNNNFRIITCGLSQEEINIVIDNLPKKDYKLDVFDTVYDLIAQYASIYIINVAVFEENELDLLWNYYKEINGNTDESIFLLGKSTIPHELKKTILLVFYLLDSSQLCSPITTPNFSSRYASLRGLTTCILN